MKEGMMLKGLRCAPHGVQKGAKWKALQMTWSNVKHKYRLANEWIENSSAKKDFVVLVGEKLEIRWWSVFAEQNANYLIES